jgi:hypothetical protein
VIAKRRDPALTRARSVDANGVEQAPGCSLAGWVNGSAPVAGWHVVTCACCGAPRLVRARS